MSEDKETQLKAVLLSLRSLTQMDIHLILEKYAEIKGEAIKGIAEAFPFMTNPMYRVNEVEQMIAEDLEHVFLPPVRQAYNYYHIKDKTGPEGKIVYKNFVGQTFKT